MRTEINLETGEVETNLSDYPITWTEPDTVIITQPTISELQAQLVTIAAQLQLLQGNN